MVEMVAVVASGYEWQCPSCREDNYISVYPFTEEGEDLELKCERCGALVFAEPPEHVFG